MGRSWDFIDSLLTFSSFPFLQFVNLRSDGFQTTVPVSNINKATCSRTSAGQKRPSIMTEAAHHQSRRPIKEAPSGGCRASNITAVQPSCSGAPVFDWITPFTSELCSCSSSINLCSVLEIKTSLDGFAETVVEWNRYQASLQKSRVHRRSTTPGSTWRWWSRPLGGVGELLTAKYLASPKSMCWMSYTSCILTSLAHQLFAPLLITKVVDIKPIKQVDDASVSSSHQRQQLILAGDSFFFHLKSPTDALH